MEALTALASGKRPAEGGDADADKKSKFLKPYNLMPTKVLNPMGKSGLPRGTDKDIWKAMGSGDKKSTYFSEYCDTEEPQRQFVAFSRAMEVNAKACDELLSNKFVKVCLKPDVFNALKTEVDGILPSFNYLNATDVLAEGKGSIYDMSNTKKGSRVCTATDVKTHVTKVKAFVANKDSVLKCVLELFSMGGLSWAAFVHGKCTEVYMSQSASDEFEARAVQFYVREGVSASSGSASLSGLNKFDK